MSHEAITLKFTPREVVGKRLHGLRASGQVPAVIHDHGKDSIIIQAEYNPLQKVVQQAGGHHVIQLEQAGGTKKYTVLVKDVSYDPYKNTVTHVVFNAIKANEKVDAEIPVHFRYAEGDEKTPAEQAGLIVLHNTETVAVESLPKDLPDVLFVPAEKLAAVGDQVTVGDVIAQTGVLIKDEPTIVLATVFEPSALAAANDAAGGDAEAVVDDVTADNGSDSDQASQAEESRPGGKDQKEPKQSNVDANK